MTVVIFIASAYVALGVSLLYLRWSYYWRKKSRYDPAATPGNALETVFVWPAKLGWVLIVDASGLIMDLMGQTKRDRANRGP